MGAGQRNIIDLMMFGDDFEAEPEELHREVTFFPMLKSRF